MPCSVKPAGIDSDSDSTHGEKLTQISFDFQSSDSGVNPCWIISKEYHIHAFY